MNLVTDPWIPVINRDSRHRLVSLRDVFADGENIADLSANPCQRIALMRLLICIAQAALDGPADEADWRACRPRLIPAALDYLAKWQHRFNLFGEHAFLQVDGLDPTPNALADKIDLTLACGNNPTLFDHEATPDGRIPQNVVLVLNLLVYQSFSCGGTFSTAIWNGQQTPPNGVRRAPCLEEAMAHTLLRGGTIIETVHLNILTTEQIHSLPNMDRGQPCWEYNCLNRPELEKSANTYLGRLVPVSRSIRVTDGTSAIILGEAMRYPQLPEQRDPFGTVYDTAKSRLGKTTSLTYLSVQPDRHAWRDLAAVLSLKTLNQSVGAAGALNLHHLRACNATFFDIWIGGLAADQSKLLDMCEWNLTLSTSLLDSLVLARYQRGVEAANKAKQRLSNAIRVYSKSMNGATEIWSSNASAIFWGQLDIESAVLQDSVTDDRFLVANWFSVVEKAMYAAYSQTCPHETPRQIQAYAQGLKVLEAWKGAREHGA